ncbi:MAG: diguanylate cyclase, partial [Treponema sp.]|nr:diguanylate cyclase [Treponema sp.]
MNKVKLWTPQQATRTLILSSMLVSLLLLGFAIFSTFQFLRLEQSMALQAQERVQILLHYQLDQVTAVTADYSRWDDTWLYMQGKNPDYPEVNFTEESLENLGFAFVALYTTEGQLYFSFSAVEKNTAEPLKTIPPSLQQDCHGILILSEKPFIVAIQRILRSDLSGPPQGFLIFGKYIDEQLEQTLSQLSGTNVQINIAQTAETPHTSINLQPQMSFKVSEIDVASHIPGLLENTRMVLSVRVPRDLFWNGFRSVAVLFLFAGVISTILLINIRSARQLLAYETNSALILEQQVTERTEALRMTNETLMTYKKIIENTGEGILITDLSGVIQKINPAIAEMCGFSKEEIVGQKTSIFKSGMHSQSFYKDLWDKLIDTGHWEGEIWNRKKDGALMPYWLSIDTLKNIEEKPCKYVAFYIDIAQLKQTQEKLNNLAFYDSLTGLPNRALFMDRLDQVLSRTQRDKNRFALLYMDLDHFKDVNDGYGHQVGDELLILAAHRIKAQVRDSDTVCRLGGDEFTIILEDIHRSADAGMVAKKVIEALREPFFIHEREIYIGCSVGIALYPYDGATIQELVKNADAAMYDAKEQGRGQYRFASGAAGLSSRHRIEVEASIRKAMDENRFVLCYQPLVSSGSAEAGKPKGIIGAEALIRIKNPDESIIPPGQFIEVAEETGLIIPMGGWALKQACKDAKEWELSGKPIQVSVNVSQRQFERGHIIKQTEEALKESGLSPRL